MTRAAAHKDDLPERAFLQQLVRFPRLMAEAMVETGFQLHVMLFRGLDHGSALSRVPGERLFTDDVLPRLQHADARLRVDVVRRRDNHEIDVVPTGNPSPVRAPLHLELL